MSGPSAAHWLRADAASGFSRCPLCSRAGPGQHGGVSGAAQVVEDNLASGVLILGPGGSLLGPHGAMHVNDVLRPGWHVEETPGPPTAVAGQQTAPASVTEMKQQIAALNEELRAVRRQLQSAQAETAAHKAQLSATNGVERAGLSAQASQKTLPQGTAPLRPQTGVRTVETAEAARAPRSALAVLAHPAAQAHGVSTERRSMLQFIARVLGGVHAEAAAAPRSALAVIATRSHTKFGSARPSMLQCIKLSWSGAEDHGPPQPERTPQEMQERVHAEAAAAPRSALAVIATRSRTKFGPAQPSMLQCIKLSWSGAEDRGPPQPELTPQEMQKRRITLWREAGTAACANNDMVSPKQMSATSRLLNKWSTLSSSTGSLKDIMQVLDDNNDGVLDQAELAVFARACGIEEGERPFLWASLLQCSDSASDKVDARAIARALKLSEARRNLADWLCGVRLHEVVALRLLPPEALATLTSFESPVHCLVDLAPDRILHRLQGIGAELRAYMCHALADFAAECPPEVTGRRDSDTETGGGSKFAWSSAGKGRDALFGDVSFFRQGLNDLIGVPDTNVFEAMKAEHNSHVPFETLNYEIKSTPADEWEFVVDPVPGKSYALAPHARTCVPLDALMLQRPASTHQDPRCVGCVSCLSREEVLAFSKVSI